MKKKRYFPVFLTLLLSWLWADNAFSQAPSTQGTNFFITYMKNGYQGCNGTAINEHLKAIISATDACSVTISNPNTGWTNPPINVPQNGLVEVEIPYNQAYNVVSESIQSKGLLVSATDTISLVISNEATNSFDASFVLPTPVLADEYIVQNFVPTTYNPSGSCSGATRSCFVIIATENNTIIDITPTRITEGGKPANVTFNITLNRGETYFVYSQQSGTNGDLSGSRIKARDCKKIQVFNGNILTTIPGTESNGYDHIFEQAMPIAYWGKKFILTSSLNRQGGDFVRITALENGTQIFRDGALLNTINANATYEFLLTANPGVAYIETSNPCAVNLYNTTSYFDNSSLGDPSMLWISPVEQQIKDIVFSTFQANDGSISMNAVNVVCLTASVSSMQLDGNNIAAQFQPVLGNSDYSYARIIIQQGTHRLRNTTGFVGHVYGFGSAKGYAYSIGSSMINLNRGIYIDGIAATEYGSEHSFCQYDTIHFSADYPTDSSSVIWDMGDGSRFVQDSVSYSYNTAGTFQVMNIISLHEYNCLGNLYDTLFFNINIEPYIDTVLYDTICYGGNYNRWGFQKDSVISDWQATDSATNIIRCGSATLYLKVMPINHHFTVNGVVYLEDTVILCNGDIGYLGTDYNQSHTFYYWNTGVANPEIMIVAEGAYTLTILDSIRSCRHDDTIYVISTPYPVADFDTYPVEGCTPFFVQMHNFTDLDNDVHPYEVTISYTWEVYDEWGQLLFISNEIEPKFEFTQQGNYTIILIATTNMGCTDTLIRHNFIHVIQQPHVEFIAIPETQLLSDDGIYFHNFTDINDLTSPGTTWYWDFGDGTTDSTNFSPTHSYEDWGDYVVTLYIENRFGCSDKISHLVSIEADLKFPNIITPNGDGLNDVFAIENLNTTINPDDPARFRTNRLSIFNRWGRKVYDAENYDTFVKNGDITVGKKAFSGENCPDGTYYYTFDYRGKLRTVNLNGTLIIVR